MTRARETQLASRVAGEAEECLCRRIVRGTMVEVRLADRFVFLWFGLLKFLPGLSPAQDLAARTLEGQYIIKNLVLMSAAVVIGATVRGGALVADPPSRE